MSLQQKITIAIKEAMKAKDQERLAALRAVKSELLLAQTDKTAKDNELSSDQEIKILQKLVKQRKDSAQIYKEQNRADLADPEEAQAAIISEFLPEQLSLEEITVIVQKIIAEVGATSIKQMGQVMGKAQAELSGKADGKTISGIIKTELA